MGEAAQGRIFPRWLVVLITVLAVGFLLYALRTVLTPVFFAFLIAYLLDPLVDRFEGMGIPRALGITILLVLVLGGLTLFLVLAVPGIVADAVAFAQELPGQLEQLLTRLEPWLADMGVQVPHSVDEAIAQYQIDTGQLAREGAGPVAAVIGWVVGGTASVIGAIVGLLMIPIFAFYLLYDFDRMIESIRGLIPWRVRPFVVDVTREVDEVLSQFVRGQVLVMIILAVLYAVGYSVVGIRLAVVIGIVAGLLSFIPYVGGAVALGLALLMAFLDFQGWGQVVGVVVVYAIIQVLEGFVITPKIVGDKVGLSAVWVLFALMVAGEVFGFMGVLLAVPAAAVIKIFVLRAVAWYRKTSVFLEGAPDEAVARAYASEEPALEGILHEEGLPDDPDVAQAKHTVEEERADAKPAATLEEAVTAAAESVPPPWSEGERDEVGGEDDEEDDPGPAEDDEEDDPGPAEDDEEADPDPREADGEGEPDPREADEAAAEEPSEADGDEDRER